MAPKRKPAGAPAEQAESKLPLHNLREGEDCWLVVGGEDKDNANIHPAVVTEIAADGLKVTRKAWVDLRFELDEGEPVPREYEEIDEISGLSVREGEYTQKAVISEGNGKCTLMTKDLGFPDIGYDDMVAMKKLNDAELCYNLRVRCMNKKPYCRCGVTLVAINLYEPRDTYKPGGENEAIYSTATKNKYKAQTDRDLEDPHCWSLASHCYKQVILKNGKNNNQSIVITGESGAGKTFNTKMILDFLADMGGKPVPDGEKKITDLMLDSTPILEGFGNANMPRNPDSSRFGKLYKVFINPKDDKITGCSITPYMLEKSRVGQQQMCERNFHIFYRMIAGMNDEQKAAYKIKDFEDYVYLRGGSGQLKNNYTRIYGDTEKGFQASEQSKPEPEPRIFEDAEKMLDTQNALEQFFDQQDGKHVKDSNGQIDTIWRCTAGALWLGNVEYTGVEAGECEPVNTGDSGMAIDIVAELWQVDRTKLYNSLFKETILMPGGRETLCARNLSDSIILRDSMARSVYNQLFVWMVESMSTVLSSKDPACKPDRDPFIGVLDIFGFEFYAAEQLVPLNGVTMNTLDQFCINMCNEVLQGEFVRVIFDLEQNLYEEQLGKKIPIDFERNDDTIEIMYKNHAGPPGKNTIVSAMMTVQTNKQSGKDADKMLYSELGKVWKDKKTKYGNDTRPAGDKTLAARRIDMEVYKGKKIYAQKGPYGYDPHTKRVPKELDSQTPGVFRLDHYAANVTYDIRDWVDKNRDKLTSDSYDCLFSSTLRGGFMVEQFTMKQANSAKSAVATDFARSLEELVAELQTTNCNFVRCLKTSNPLARFEFKNALVLNQLKYTGMLDTLIIRRAGFPVRMNEQDFQDHYRVIAVNEAEKGAEQLYEALKARTASIVAKLKEKPPELQRDDAIRFGKPKKKGVERLILMRDWFASMLTDECNAERGKSGVIVQAAYRMGNERHSYSRQIAAMDIQSCIRTMQAHVPFANFRNAILSSLPEARGLIARSVAARASENNSSAANKASTISFLQENVALIQKESEERKHMNSEDQYSTLIAFARFGEKIVSLKADAMKEAETAMKQASERNAHVTATLDTLKAKDKELDDRWAKMEQQGTVRSVPLVRQYKASAQPFQTPSKEQYKFRYSFTYTGSSN
jgi:myosin heavy subunit